MLRIPHCLDKRLIDDGKVVNPLSQLWTSSIALGREKRRKKLRGVVRDTTV
jgi:hypothetical protein